MADERFVLEHQCHEEQPWARLELGEDKDRIKPDTIKGDLFDAVTHTFSLVPYFLAHPLIYIRALLLERPEQEDDYQDRGDLG